MVRARWVTVLSRLGRTRYFGLALRRAPWTSIPAGLLSLMLMAFAAHTRWVLVTVRQQAAKRTPWYGTAPRQASPICTRFCPAWDRHFTHRARTPFPKRVRLLDLPRSMIRIQIKTSRMWFF